MQQPKDLLDFENRRNKEHADLYARLFQAAYGEDWQVMVGHHLLYQHGSDLTTEGEIPSADTMMFDHGLMGRVFGKRATIVMLALASVPSDRRDDLLEYHLLERDISARGAIREQETERTDIDAN